MFISQHLFLENLKNTRVLIMFFIGNQSEYFSSKLKPLYSIKNLKIE